MSRLNQEIEQIEKILKSDLPKIEEVKDSHVVEVLLKTLDRVEARLSKPGRYQGATSLEAVALDAIRRDAFLQYGQLFRRWLTQPEEQKGKLQSEYERLKTAAQGIAAKLPSWYHGRKERED